MTVRRLLVAIAPVVAICATLAVSVGTASASVNVVTAIHQQDLRVGGSGAIQRLERLEKTDRHNPGKLYRAFDKAAGEFAHSASVVSHSSADGARQVKGRHDWVTATRALSSGLYKLGHAFHLIATHHAGPKVDRLILAAQKENNRAQRLGREADRLLGVNSYS